MCSDISVFQAFLALCMLGLICVSVLTILVVVGKWFYDFLDFFSRSQSPESVFVVFEMDKPIHVYSRDDVADAYCCSMADCRGLLTIKEMPLHSSFKGLTTK